VRGAAVLLALAWIAPPARAAARANAQEARGERDEGVEASSVEGEIALWLSSTPALAASEREARLARVAAFGTSAAEALIAVWNDPATTAGARPLVLEALRSLAEADVLRAVESVRAGTTSAAERSGCLHVLGEVGSAASIDVVLELLATAGEPAVSAGLARALSAALPRILERDARAHERLEAAARGLDERRVWLLVEALEHAPSSTAALVVSEALQLHPALADPALHALAEIARSSWVWLADGPRAELRRWLDAPEPAIKKCAAVALARLRDPETAVAMLAWLEHGGERDRKTAVWCLETILGVTLPAELRRWRALCDEELAWKERRGRRSIATLDSRNPTTVVQVIGELSRARLHRHDVAAELTPLLASPNPGIQRAVCGALARLGSARAVPALVAALDDPDDERRGWALDALRELTGRELTDPKDWRALVGPVD